MSWHTMSIFIRTCWTGKKKFFGSLDIEDSLCKLCLDPMQDTMHLYYNCPTAQNLYTNLQELVNKKTGMVLEVSVNSIMFHTFSSKDHTIKTRLSAMVSAAKYTLWKLNTAQGDPDIPSEIIWLKFVTNVIWVGDTQISLGHDADFWHKFKSIVREWKTLII